MPDDRVASLVREARELARSRQRDPIGIALDRPLLEAIVTVLCRRLIALEDRFGRID